jgi:hypothetical protein
MKLIKYRLKLIEKNVQMDHMDVEVDEEKPVQLINHIRSFKIKNKVLGNKRSKVIKEIIN